MTAVLQNVSDTALWVAYYRGLEGDRPDALFHDPLAKILIDDRAQQIAESMPKTAAHTQQNVLMRTLIIDCFIETLIREEKIDTLVNLGAGFDTRPYRLKLPSSFRWIEVDYANLMEYKNEKLSAFKPSCQLERHSIDLSDRKSRQSFFEKISRESKTVAILTEGVLPYLVESEVSLLSEDLQAQFNFAYWIADYVSPAVYKYLRNDTRMEKMKNAPFQFFPTDYLSFFKSHQWSVNLMFFIQEEAQKHGRELPPPPWVAQLPEEAREKMKSEFMRSSGYMLLQRD